MPDGNAFVVHFFRRFFRASKLSSLLTNAKKYTMESPLNNGKPVSHVKFDFILHAGDGGWGLLLKLEGCVLLMQRPSYFLASPLTSTNGDSLAKRRELICTNPHTLRSSNKLKQQQKVKFRVQVAIRVVFYFRLQLVSTDFIEISSECEIRRIRRNVGNTIQWT